MTLDDFMRRVEFEANTGCWLWSGAPGAGGYGVAKFDGRNQKAHRVSWALHTGEMPPRVVKVCHRCDTPACVNPAHLWTGSQADNVADMVAKRRHKCVPMHGEANPGARLTSAAVVAIREGVANGIPQRRFAEQFNVSPMTVSRAARGESWNHENV